MVVYFIYSHHNMIEVPLFALYLLVHLSNLSTKNGDISSKYELTIPFLTKLKKKESKGRHVVAKAKFKILPVVFILHLFIVDAGIIFHRIKCQMIFQCT